MFLQKALDIVAINWCATVVPPLIAQRGGSTNSAEPCRVGKTPETLAQLMIPLRGNFLCLLAEYS
jgi:hypothetical protein